MGNRVWKIGSRWSVEGSNQSSIIDIFRKYQIVFLGSKERDRFKSEVKKGDYIAIGDGFNVNTLSKVLIEPLPITQLGIQFTDEEKNRFSFEDWVIGAKVQIVELKVNEMIYYKERGAFCEAKQISNEVIQKYDRKNMNEKIRVESITLNELLNKKLVVPEYQRPYLWGGADINKLLCQIEIHKKIAGEKPMFYLGSIVLHKENYNYNIIDGQQRITTMAIINHIKKNELNILYDNLISHQNIKRNHNLLITEKIEDLEEIDFDNINVTVIITGSQDDAYNFFETLNTGGVRLTGIDIIKAHHLRSVKPNRIDELAVLWEANQKHIAEVVTMLLKARKWNILNPQNIPSRRSDDKYWKLIITDEFSEKTLKDGSDLAYSFWKTTNTTMEKTGSNYAVRQPIADGENTINYLLSFIKLYKTLFINNRLLNTKYWSFNNEIIENKDGTIDLRAMYQIALMCYASRFGLEKAKNSYLWIFRLVYSLRVEEPNRVMEVTVINHNKNTHLLDKVLLLHTENEVLFFLKSYNYKPNAHKCNEGVKGRYIARIKEYFSFTTNTEISDFDTQLSQKIIQLTHNGNI